MLKQELREPAIYNAIIKAIAEGASRLNDITTKVGEENSVVAKYLKTLIDLGIVKKEMPITEKPGKKRSIFWQIIFSVSGTVLFRSMQVLLIQDELQRPTRMR